MGNKKKKKKQGQKSHPAKQHNADVHKKDRDALPEGPDALADRTPSDETPPAPSECTPAAKNVVSCEDGGTESGVAASEPNRDANTEATPESNREAAPEENPDDNGGKKRLLSGNVRRLLIAAGSIFAAVIVLTVAVGAIVISRISTPINAEVGGKIDLSPFTEGLAGKVCRVEESSDLSTDAISSRELTLVFFGFVRHNVPLEVRDTTVPLLELKNVSAADGIEVLPEDFVASASDLTKLTFRFGSDDGSDDGYDAPKADGVITKTVTVIAADEGGNEAVATARLTTGDPSLIIEAELGTPTDVIDKMIAAAHPETVLYNTKTLEADRCGNHTVVVSGADTDFHFLVSIRDTTPPTGIAHSFNLRKGASVTEEDLVTDISDFSDVTVTMRKEIDFEKTGKFSLPLVLADAHGNKTHLMSEIVIHDVPETIEFEVGLKQEVMTGLILNGDKNLSLPQNFDVSELALGENHIDLQGAYNNISVIVTMKDTVPPKLTLRDLTAYTFSEISPEDFVVSCVDKSKVTFSFREAVSTDQNGEFDVTVIAEDAAGNKTSAQTKLTVIPDEAPPVIYGVHDISAVIGRGISYLDGVYAVDEADGNVTVSVDASAVDPQTAGTYRIFYTASDKAGHTARAEAVLTLINDNVAPVISGVRDIYITVGESVSYLSGVFAVDDNDGAVAVSVDSSGVNTAVAGTYTVFYTASDLAGNKATVSATVTVDAITLNTVYAMADEILAQIITPGMSTREQAWAVYQWSSNNIRYSSSTAYLMGNFVDAAYSGFRTRSGNCYMYYACSSAMLTRLGIPNIEIHRNSTENPHYWNLVQIYGSWYHFDACPHYAYAPLESFLLTDAQVAEYSRSQVADYYSFDHWLYPATP